MSVSLDRVPQLVIGLQAGGNCASTQVVTDVIAQETSADWWEVEDLFDSCFAPGREALSSYRLREGVEPVLALCLTIRDEGAVAAAVRNWPVRIGAAQALLLGPIAVHPTRQGEGLGAALIGRVQRDAAALGWDRILLVGDAPYYARFGFVPLAGVQMPPPTNPERVLGWGDWTGIGGAVERAAGPA